jgi:hypothetical protein
VQTTAPFVFNGATATVPLSSTMSLSTPSFSFTPPKFESVKSGAAGGAISRKSEAIKHADVSDAVVRSTTLHMIVDTEPALLSKILMWVMFSAKDFGRMAAVSSDWQRAAEADMDWHAAYLAYPGREPHIPWIVIASYGEDKAKWRIRHRVRAQIRPQIVPNEEDDDSHGMSKIPDLECNSPKDISARLEAVLNGRFMIPPGDSGLSPTEDCFVGENGLMSGLMKSVDQMSDDAVRDVRLENYGSRTQGVLIWSAEGETLVCERRWKVQSLGECYSYIWDEGEEPLPFQANFARVNPEYCAGVFHIDERLFWMTAIFFAFLRRTGYPRIDNALEMLFERTFETGGHLPFCGHCGARGPGRLQRCGRCMSEWYCNRAHQQAAWPMHKRQCRQAKGGKQIDPSPVVQAGKLTDTINTGASRRASARTVIEVSSVEQLQAALATIANNLDLPFTIQIANGKYDLPQLEIGGSDVILEGVGMHRQSSVLPGEDRSKNSQLNAKVLVKTANKILMRGLTCTQGIEVSAPACEALFHAVHVTVVGQENDAFVLSSCHKARIEDCEIFGGCDGLCIDNCICHIKNSDIRFAACRGIFANNHFTVEDVEVSNCGSYGMKTMRGGCTRLGDNDIQPGPWDNVGGGMGYGDMF